MKGYEAPYSPRAFGPQQLITHGKNEAFKPPNIWVISYPKKMKETWVPMVRPYCLDIRDKNRQETARKLKFCDPIFER